MTDTVTNLVEGDAPEAEVTPEAEEDVTAPVETQEADGEDTPESEEDSEQSEEVETEELEVDGVTYRVPKALKSGFMKNADYTQKTQEVARTREELEASRAVLEERQAAEEQDLTDRGQLAIIDKRLETLRNTNMQEIQFQNPDQFAALQAEFIQLKDVSDQLKARVETRQTELATKAEQDYANRVQAAESVLSRDIEGWSPELGTKLASFARANGVTDQQLQQVATNPAFVKILHKAHLGEEVVKQQRAIATKKKTVEVTPINKPPKGRQPQRGPSDKDSVDEWLRKRNKQLDAKRKAG